MGVSRGSASRARSGGRGHQSSKGKGQIQRPRRSARTFYYRFFFFFCLQPVARAPRCAGTHAPAMSEEIDKHVLRKYEIAQRLGKGVRAGRAAAEERSGAGRGAPRRATRAPLRGGAPPPPCELGVASARRAGGAALERAVRRAEECRQWRGAERGTHHAHGQAGACEREGHAARRPATERAAAQPRRRAGGVCARVPRARGTRGPAARRGPCEDPKAPASRCET